MGKIQNKKLILVLIVIIISALLIFNYYLKPKEKQSESEKENKEIEKTTFSQSPEVIQFEIDKLPDAFPKDIIQEKDVQIINNYEINIDSNTKQYVIRYLSKKTPQENIKIYSEYLIKNQWAIITGPLYESGLTRLSFIKDANQLEIISTPDSLKGQTVVTLTLTYILRAK